jgi:phytoene desaturase (3,4-didehydrolycopene-forming)
LSFLLLVFAPQGGFRTVSNSFEKLARDQGVSIQTGKIVTRVKNDGVHVCDANAEGNLSGEAFFVPADLIIVNADLPYATQSLVASSSSSSSPSSESESRFDWDDSYLFSSGVVAFHWCIDKELSDLNTHNVFLAAASGRSQAEQSWRLLRKGFNSDIDNGDKISVEPFNFYVHAPTKTDPTSAPKGCDSLMVLVPCPKLQRKKEYANLSRKEALQKYKEQFTKQYISELKKAVLDRFAAIESMRNLEDHIVSEVVDTPGTYADYYNVAAGTPFAISHGFGQLSLTRPGAKYRTKDTPNILYCGASSRPGNGVPLVLIGSRLVAKKAISLLKNTENEKVTESKPRNNLIL